MVKYKIKNKNKNKHFNYHLENKNKEIELEDNHLLWQIFNKLNININKLYYINKKIVNNIN